MLLSCGDLKWRLEIVLMIARWPRGPEPFPEIFVIRILIVCPVAFVNPFTHGMTSWLSRLNVRKCPDTGGRFTRLDWLSCSMRSGPPFNKSDCGRQAIAPGGGLVVRAGINELSRYFGVSAHGKNRPSLC